MNKNNLIYRLIILAAVFTGFAAHLVIQNQERLINLRNGAEINSFSEQDREEAFTEYITENINFHTPVETEFEVFDLEFVDRNTVMVNYGDDFFDLEARAEYYIEEGEVIVDHFELINY